MNNRMDADFAHFLDSMISLDALQRVTTDLDGDLKDSQAVMNDIKGMIDSLPARVVSFTPDPANGSRHERLSNFLAAGTPNLVMPDMEANIDVDIKEVIATMKVYFEDIKSLIESDPETQQAAENPIKLEKLELDEYASSLDQLSQRLSHLKLKKATVSNDTSGVDAKLQLLCGDVNTFTKMIQAKMTMNEENENWPQAPSASNAMDYDALINKVLIDLDGVSCLLRSSN